MKFAERLIQLKTLPFILLALAALAMASCVPFWKDGDQQAQVASINRLPPHQSWCYRTLAEIECYAQPQNVPAERLVNVDPQSQYPLTVEDNAKVVAKQGM